MLVGPTRTKTARFTKSDSMPRVDQPVDIQPDSQRQTDRHAGGWRHRSIETAARGGDAA